MNSNEIKRIKLKKHLTDSIKRTNERNKFISGWSNNETPNPLKHDCKCDFFELHFQNIKVQIHLLDPIFQRTAFIYSTHCT